MTDLRASLGAPDPSELVDAPKAPTIVVQRDAIREAEDKAVDAVLNALREWDDLNKGSRSLTTPQAAKFIARAAFGAMVIPEDYVRGYRDAMAKVRQALGPIASVDADPFVKATDATEESQ